MQGFVDGSFYVKVRKKSFLDFGILGGFQVILVINSLDYSDYILFVSSDFGYFIVFVRMDKMEECLVLGIRRGLSVQEKVELDQLFSGFGLEDFGSFFKEMIDV